MKRVIIGVVLAACVVAAFKPLAFIWRYYFGPSLLDRGPFEHTVLFLKMEAQVMLAHVAIDSKEARLSPALLQSLLPEAIAKSPHQFGPYRVVDEGVIAGSQGQRITFKIEKEKLLVHFQWDDADDVEYRLADGRLLVQDVFESKPVARGIRPARTDFTLYVFPQAILPSSV